MLLDSYFESAQPYANSGHYYYNQASCPPSPLSPPPSPSPYSPSLSPYSPASHTVFQFPPNPYNEMVSTIKEEPLPWKVPGMDPVASSSHVYDARPSPSPSPLLSQAPSSHHYLSSQPDSFFSDTIRSSNSSIQSYSAQSNSSYYLPYQPQGTFGHSLGSFHTSTSSNMELVSSPYYHTSSPLAQEELQSYPLVDSVHDHSSFPSSPSSLPTLPAWEEEPKVSVKNEGGEEGVVCRWRECGKVYGDKNQLVEHINSCHIEHKKGCEDYPCYWGSCPRRWKSFNAKYKLLTHIRVHTGEKPFSCKAEGCKRSFARLENLKIHNRSHTGEKPFLCKYHQICNKAFSNSSDRAKHEQTHKDPKPYACEVFGCAKKYTDPSSLRKHVKNHTKEEQEQVRQMKGSTKGRSKETSQERWFDIDPSMPVSSNLGLLSGGGVVVDTVQVDTQHVYGGVGAGEAHSRRRGEVDDSYNYFSTPLYLQV